MPFSSADCAMVFCVERADVARIASRSAFLNIDARLAFPFRIGKSESQVGVFFSEDLGRSAVYKKALQEAFRPFGAREKWRWRY